MARNNRSRSLLCPEGKNPVKQSRVNTCQCGGNCVNFRPVRTGSGNAESKKIERKGTELVMVMMPEKVMKTVTEKSG